MYTVYVPKKWEKKWNEAKKQTTDKNGYSLLIDLLKNYPKGKSTFQNIPVKKIRQYWIYRITSGDRIVYKVYDSDKRYNFQPTVIVAFIGNHRDYELFLRAN